MIELKAHVLGRLELEAVLEGGETKPLDLELRAATEAALRCFIAFPNGASAQRVKVRSGYASAHDIVSKLRKILKPAGLTVSHFPGPVGYRLQSSATGEPIVIHSDLGAFREGARSFLKDGAERLQVIVADDETDAETYTAQLRVIEEQVTDLLALWRTDDPDERTRCLQNDPQAKRANEDLKLDRDLRVSSITCGLALAKVQRAPSRLRSVREELGWLDRFTDLSTIDDLRSRIDELSLDLTEERLDQIPSRVDVFLAAPMASVADEYDPTRQLALKVSEALCNDCGVSTVYFPGSAVGTVDDFEEPAVSLQKNMGPFGDARHFVMLLPKLVPSSVLVEAGMALMLNMPSVYLVPDRKTALPWLLQDVAGAGVDSLGKVRVVEYDDEADLMRKLKNSGDRLFPR